MKETEYWNNFYSNKNAPVLKSPFASWLIKKIDFTNKNIVEFGSGNGRDTFFLKNKCKKIIAFDGSDKAVNISNDKLKKKSRIKGYRNNLVFKKLAFTNKNIETGYKINFKVDISYSRFFIHALNSSQEKLLIKYISSIHKKGSFSAHEFRTLRDPLLKYKKHNKNNEVITDHYRRFIDPLKIIDLFNSHNLRTIFFEESKDFAIYGNDRPSVARIILIKD
jgi:hypothetical protein